MGDQKKSLLIIVVLVESSF